MKVTAILAGLAMASAKPYHSRDGLEKRFQGWMADHEVEFEDSSEYLYRLGVYAKNLERIEAHNADKTQDFTMAMNQFGHLTGEEFKAMYTGVKVPAADHTIPRTTFKASNGTAADSVDWTTKGAVTKVKNQGSCGSCWSFSTTGGMEGAYYKANNKLVSFSEQNLVSCDTVDSACNGGLMDNAFGWIKKNGGLCTEDDYPYVSGQGNVPKCKTSCNKVSGSTVKSITDVSTVPQVTPCSEKTMMAAVAQQPISVAIEADQSGFQFYSGGVMTKSCGTQLDHGVLVVGYGTSGGKDYWKIKNSWGATWGDSGYIMIERGNKQKGGQCGVLLAASYPVL